MGAKSGLSSWQQCYRGLQLAGFGYLSAAGGFWIHAGRAARGHLPLCNKCKMYHYTTQGSAVGLAVVRRTIQQVRNQGEISSTSVIPILNAGFFLSWKLPWYSEINQKPGWMSYLWFLIYWSHVIHDFNMLVLVTLYIFWFVHLGFSMCIFISFVDTWNTLWEPAKTLPQGSP